MKDALHYGPFHECDHGSAHYVFGVDAGILHADDVVKVEAVHPLHHEHPSRDQLRVRPGDDVAILLKIVQHCRHVEHVGSLHPEVEFFDDRLGEKINERRRVSEGCDWDAANKVRRQPSHHTEIFVHELRN